MLYLVPEQSNCHSGTCTITQKAYIRQKFTVHFFSYSIMHFVSKKSLQFQPPTSKHNLHLRNMFLDTWWSSSWNSSNLSSNAVFPFFHRTYPVHITTIHHPSQVTAAKNQTWRTRRVQLWPNTLFTTHSEICCGSCGIILQAVKFALPALLLFS
jgi:hypothetical protein